MVRSIYYLCRNPSYAWIEAKNFECIRKYLNRVLTRSGPYSDGDWIPGPETITSLESSKIL